MHLSQPSGLFKVLLQRGFPSACEEPGVSFQNDIASALETSLKFKLWTACLSKIKTCSSHGRWILSRNKSKLNRYKLHSRLSNRHPKSSVQRSRIYFVLKINWNVRSLFWCDSFHRECCCSSRFRDSTPFGLNLRAQKLLFLLVRLFRSRSLLILETSRRIHLKFYKLDSWRWELTH